MIRWAAMAGAGALLAAAGAAQAGAVQVRVTNVAPKGDVFVQLCTQAEYGRRCALGARVPPQAGETVVSFPSVAPGAYAASAFQDLDGNGRLSFGMMGPPKEPWGYSRAAKAVFGPAAFKDAVVTVPAAGAVIPIALGH